MGKFYHIGRKSFLLILFSGVIQMTFSQSQPACRDTAAAQKIFGRASVLLQKYNWKNVHAILDSAAVEYGRAGCFERYIHCQTLKAEAFLRTIGPDAADSVIQNAVRVSLEKGIPRYLPVLLNRYAELLETRGDLERANLILDSARNLLWSSGDTLSLDFADNLNLYGRLNNFRRNYALAMDYLVKAARLFELTGTTDHYFAANNAMMLGELYGSRGDLQKALHYFNRCLAYCNLYLEEGNTFRVNVESDIALVYLYQGEFEKSRVLFEKILAIYQAGNNNTGIVKVVVNLAYISFLERDYEQVIHLLARADSLYLKEIGEKNQASINLLLLLGKSYAATGHMLESAEISTRLINSLSNVQDTALMNFPDTRNAELIPPLVDAAIDKTRSLRSLFLETGSSPYLDGALEGCRFVLSLFRLFPYEVVDAQAPYNLLDEFSSFFPLAMSTSELSRQAESRDSLIVRMFEVSEQSRGSILFSAICQSRAIQFSGIPDSLRLMAFNYKSELEDLSGRIASAESIRQMSEADSLRMIRMVERRYFLQRNYESTIHHIRTFYPEYSRLRYGSGAPNLSDVCKAIPDPETVMLEYFVADTCLYTFVIRKDGADVVRTSVDSGFRPRIASFLSSIRKVNTDLYSQEAFALHQILIRPVKPWLENARRLIIIPDPAMIYLPFEALIGSDPGTGLTDFSKPDYLVNRFDISYHYSASLWMESIRHVSPSQPVNVLAMAPVFGPPNERSDKLSESRLESASEETRMSPRRDSTGRYSFSKLGFSEKEVRSIIQISRDKQWGATGYLYQDATEERFRTEAPGHSVIHLASHSFANEKDPSLSGIAFYSLPEDSINPQHDGILYAPETYSIQLNADLLVLSSCESGMGKLARGEGLLSLTRGFLYSGCRNILYSLWKVPDRSTSELMVRFYSDLTSEKNYSGALAKAKREMISQPGTAFPSAWAGFVLIGTD